MNRKTAWTVKDAVVFLKSMGLNDVEASSLKPFYVKQVLKSGGNFWCIPCWELMLNGQKRYLRMDEAELVEFTPSKVTPIMPSQGVRLGGSTRFKFLKQNKEGYAWVDVDDPMQVGDVLWEEIVAPGLLVRSIQ